MRDEGKNKDCAYEQKLSYYDYINNCGITKYIKGNTMQSEGKRVEKHSYELRLHLDEKILRVGSLPDYESIVELDDINKIDPQEAYRFYIAII